MSSSPTDSQVDPAFLAKQLMAGFNELAKTVSSLDMRTSELEARRIDYGGSVGGDGGAAPSMPSAFEGTNDRAFAVKSQTEGENSQTRFYITNCRFMFGRKVIKIEDDYELPTAEIDGRTTVADGVYSLIIPHEDPQDASVEPDTSEVSDDEQTVIPLFEYEDGSIVDDYRGMFTVPVYEFADDFEEGE